MLKSIKKLWYRYTNKTQRMSLNMMERTWDEGINYKCPECNFRCRNEIKFEEHISEQHGYPKDMDINKYLTDISIKQGRDPVKKANSDYLKYLSK